MAGDAERPSSDPEIAKAPDGTATVGPVLPAAEVTPAGPDTSGFGPQVESSDTERDAARDEPAGAASWTPPAERRSALPTVLAILGVIVVALLLGTLYTLYNPPVNDALRNAQADVATLKQRVAALEGRTSGDASLASDVTALKGAVADNAAGAKAGSEAMAAVGPLAAKVAELGTSLSALKDSVAALPKVDLGPLQQQVAALDKRMEPLESYFNAPKSTAQVTEARQNGSAAETRAAPLAVMAQGILDALDTGRPFGNLLKAVAKLGVDDATLAPLRAVADKGAATRADLAKGFASVQDATVVAAAPVETGTMFDRMLSNAQGLVTVTRTGAAKGNDAASVASRITNDLGRGDLAAASAAWDQLPAASKQRSAAWADSLHARLKAEEAARSLAAKAVDDLASAP